MARVHECVACGTPGIPHRYSLCPACWVAVPVRLRDKLQGAWLGRMWDHPHYCEALAAVLLWRAEKTSPRPEGGLWESD